MALLEQVLGPVVMVPLLLLSAFTLLELAGRAARRWQGRWPGGGS